MKHLLLFFFLVISLPCFSQDTLRHVDPEDLGNWKIRLVKDSSLVDDALLKHFKFFPQCIEVSNSNIRRIDGFTLRQRYGQIRDDHVFANGMGILFSYNYSSPDGYRANGVVHFNKVDSVTMIGTYEYTAGRPKELAFNGMVELMLEKIWCCGNHSPVHCEKSITADCKKIH